MSAEQHDNVPAERQPHDYVRSAFEIMAEGAPAMAESLVNLGKNAKSEMVRMMAATAVFDRVGLPGKVDVGITSVHLQGGLVDTGGKDPAEIVAQRLRLLEEHRANANVIEGEVVQFPGEYAEEDQE